MDDYISDYIDVEKRFCFPPGIGSDKVNEGDINIRELFDNLGVINRIDLKKELFAHFSYERRYQYKFRNFYITQLSSYNASIVNYELRIRNHRLVLDTYIRVGGLVLDDPVPPTMIIIYPEFLPHIKYLCDYIKDEAKIINEKRNNFNLSGHGDSYKEVTEAIEKNFCRLD